MKNKQFFVGILVMTLVFGLISIGCPTDTKEEDTATKFEGQWVNSGTTWHLTYKFTNNSVEFIDRDSISSNWSGTFTFTEDKITFKKSDGTQWDQGYNLSGNRLTLTEDSSHAYGIFQKQ
jgi:hypothetical protein